MQLTVITGVSIPQNPDGAFRFSARQMFITCPKVFIQPSECCDLLMGIFKKYDVQYVVASVEEHADGDPHVHALVTCKRKINLRNSRFLDPVFHGKHAHMQPVRNPAHVMNYVIKHGNWDARGVDPVAFVKAAGMRKSTKASIIAGKIVSGCTMTQLLDEHPDYMLMNLQKVKAFKAFIDGVVSEKKETWKLLCMGQMRQEHIEILIWLNANILRPRKFKQKQLYLYGPPNTGKTSLAIWLERFCRIYWAPMHEEFYDAYDDNAYDLVVLDEFAATKHITHLNSFLDGSPMTLRTKGGQYFKKSKLPVMILSNKGPNEIYENVSSWQKDALISRLTVVRTETYISIREVDDVLVNGDNKEKLPTIHEEVLDHGSFNEPGAESPLHTTMHQPDASMEDILDLEELAINTLVYNPEELASFRSDLCLSPNNDAK